MNWTATDASNAGGSRSDRDLVNWQGIARSAELTSGAPLRVGNTRLISEKSKAYGL